MQETDMDNEQVEIEDIGHDQPQGLDPIAEDQDQQDQFEQQAGAAMTTEELNARARAYVAYLDELEGRNRAQQQVQQQEVQQSNFELPPESANWTDEQYAQWQIEQAKIAAAEEVKRQVAPLVAERVKRDLESILQADGIDPEHVRAWCARYDDQLISKIAEQPNGIYAAAAQAFYDLRHTVSEKRASMSPPGEPLPSHRAQQARVARLTEEEKAAFDTYGVDIRNLPKTRRIGNMDILEDED